VHVFRISSYEHKHAYMGIQYKVKSYTGVVVKSVILN